MQFDQRLLSMNDTDVPKLVCKYTPTGRRNVNRPRIRWCDQRAWRRNKPEINYILLLIVMTVSSGNAQLLLWSCLETAIRWARKIRENNAISWRFRYLGVGGGRWLRTRVQPTTAPAPNRGMTCVVMHSHFLLEVGYVMFLELLLNKCLDWLWASSDTEEPTAFVYITLLCERNGLCSRMESDRMIGNGESKRIWEELVLFWGIAPSSLSWKKIEENTWKPQSMWFPDRNSNLGPLEHKAGELTSMPRCSLIYSCTFVMLRHFVALMG